MDMQKDIYLCFIVCSKAFDKVKHEELFQILEKLDIDGKDVRVVRNLYWDQTAALRIEGEHSEFRNIKRGARQGCVMSLDFFNLYSELILRNLENIQGLKINGENSTISGMQTIPFDSRIRTATSKAFKYCCFRE